MEPLIQAAEPPQKATIGPSMSYVDLFRFSNLRNTQRVTYSADCIDKKNALCHYAFVAFFLIMNHNRWKYMCHMYHI